MTSALRGQAYDETRDPSGEPRPGYRLLAQALGRMSAEDLEARAGALVSTFTDRGVTFAVGSGEAERPFPLDLVPRVIAAADWQPVERGVAQRVRALEAFLADVYGAGRCFADGVVPRALVTSSSHFHRSAYGVMPPNGVRVHVGGIDLVRGEDGAFRVLEDNVRVPSGVSYVIENRRAMARVLGDLMAQHRLRPVSPYPTRLLAALRAAAPESAGADPTVVVLTPGAMNAAYFEHSLLARLMGVELVEGRDLHCRRDRVYMRTTTGERRVDVVYRRVDDAWLDPVQGRPESQVGCPGLINAARAGNVALANAYGNGVADDKLVYTWMPELVRYYLGEDPLLPNVATYRLGEPADLEFVMDHLDELVVKPVDGAGGYGIVVGPQATPRRLAQLRREVLADPRAFVAQPVVQLSTVPILAGGRLAPRHVDLRPFAVNDGREVWVLPGGLTRVALAEGGLVVNSSQGGGSKDTWVLADEVARPEPEPSRGDGGWSGGLAGPPAPPRLARQAEQQ